MAAPARTPLGGQTLASKWFLDINTGTHAAPTWTPVSGTIDLKPVYDPTFKDDSDRDSGGAKSQVKTAFAWGIETKLARKVTASSATTYDPGQEKIRTLANENGISNVAEVRFYEMNVNDAGTVIGPMTEAWQGYVAVGWGEDGGAMDELDTVSVVMHGRGDRTAITHPETAALVPTVTSITPSTGAAAGGEVAYIKGQFFTGVTDVEIGTTNVDDYVLIDDYTLAIVTPALAAGPYTVEVTNAAGASTSGPTFTCS